MLKVLAIAASILCAVAAPASAAANPKCFSVDNLLQQAESLNAKVETLNGADALATYHARIGYPIPAKSNATSAIFFVLEDRVVAGLIEPNGDVCFIGRFPLDKHTIAFAAAKVGA